MKVAIITGGASGMGLAVAQALASRDDWKVHVIDFNEQHLTQQSKLNPNINFLQADVTDYQQLATTFHEICSSAGIDFVFANAGVIEKQDFYKIQQTSPPPPPDLRSVDVDLKGLINTCYLAQHYFRQSGGKGGSLILNASCGALYPSHYSPMYTAAKHGVLGLGRSIAPRLSRENIRINMICPGIVSTNLACFDTFPKGLFTPLSQISKTVLHLVDAQTDLFDNAGKRVSKERLFGLTVEINLDRVYVREIPEFCDESMKRIMEATSPERQRGGVIRDFE